MRPNGALINDGPSEIDGTPIYAVATGISRGSANEKTGPMVHVWFMPQEHGPFASLHRGLDFSVCGDCPARGTLTPKAGGGGQSSKGRFCYVNLAKAPTDVYRALQRGSYYDLSESIGALRNRVVRLGAWGDPTSAPFEVSRGVVDGARAWTGYTSRWRECDPRFRSILMASVFTPEDRDEAQEAGWRTFRVRLPDEGLARGEIVCPAAKEAGQRTVCYQCGLCSGTEGKGRASIAINVHGLAARHGYKRWRGA